MPESEKKVPVPVKQVEPNKTEPNPETEEAQVPEKAETPVKDYNKTEAVLVPDEDGYVGVDPKPVRSSNVDRP